MSILKKDTGYLLFINPATWIGFKSSIGGIFKEKQIEYLKYYNYLAATRLFEGSGKIPLAYYLLKNIGTQNDTTIYDNATGTDERFNIYSNFVPTESVAMWRKILRIKQDIGSLEENYTSVKQVNTSTLEKTPNSTYKYPIVSIKNKEIKINYTNVNNNKNNDKKLLLANSSMWYPVYDNLGIMNPESSHQFIIYSNNKEKELKQLQNYFLTNLMFYLINITRTGMNYFDNKLFEVIPNITKMTSRKDIDDKFLIHLFKLTEADLIGYKKYIDSGEGRLDETIKKKIKGFKLDIPDRVVEEIKRETEMKAEAKKITKKKKIVIKDKQSKKKSIKSQAVVSHSKLKQTRGKVKSIKSGGKNTRKNNYLFFSY